MRIPRRLLINSGFVFAVAACMLGLCGGSARAQTVIEWSSGASTTLWATNANWIGGTAPANSLTTNIALFDSTSYAFQPNAGATSIAGITVGDGTTVTAALTISTTALSIGSSGILIDANAGTVTLNNPVKLGASQNWANNSSSLLTVKGTITNVGNVTPFTLTLNGAGSGGATFTGIISDGGATGTTAIVVDTTAGTTTLSAHNTFSGGLTLTAGTLKFGIGSTIAGSGASATITNGAVGAGLLTVNGGVLDLNGIGFGPAVGGLSGSGGTIANNGAGQNLSSLAIVVSGTQTYSGTIADTTGGGAQTVAVSVAGGGTQVLAGANTYSGSTSVNSGTLDITGSWNPATSGSATLVIGNIAGNAVVNYSGGTSSFTAISGGINSSAMSVYNQTAGSVTTTGTTNVAETGYGYFNLTGGAYSVGSGFFNLTGGTSTGVAYIGGTGSFSSGEYVFLAQGGVGATASLTIGPGGAFTHNNASGSFELVSPSNNEYAVLNVTGGRVSSNTSPFEFGATTNTGVAAFVNLASGTLSTGAAMLNNGTTGGAGSGNYYLNFAGGTLQTTSSVTSVLPATVSTTNGNYTVTSTIFGPITNSASSAINAAIGATQDFAGGLTVSVGTGLSSSITTALLGATGSGITQSNLSVTGGSGYIGAPMVQFTGGTLAANGTPATGYALINGSGALVGIVITNPGEYSSITGLTVTLTGGGSAASGSVAIVGSLTTNSTAGGLILTGGGKLTLSGTNTYTGATTISSGTLQFATPGSLYNATTASWTAANILVASGATLAINFGGASDFTAGNVATLLTNLDGAVSNNGLQAGSRIGFDTTNATSTATLSSVIADTTGTGGGSVGLVKLGTNTLALGVVNTYSGGTTINAGTLQLGIANAIPSTGAVTLSGGTLSSGATIGFSDLMGPLTLSSSSTISLGAGSHQLEFSGLNYTIGTLTVTGWAGSEYGSGTSGQLIFSGIGTASSANATYASFLSNVDFSGYANGAMFITNGPNVELVPTPEPGHVLLICVGVLVMGMAIHRLRTRPVAQTTI